MDIGFSPFSNRKDSASRNNFWVFYLWSLLCAQDDDRTLQAKFYFYKGDPENTWAPILHNFVNEKKHVIPK
jgi:hypothetical protein